ncbi:hypothetical protein Tco_1002832 [Tanacetum coccineum]|uniref:Uncharacterized protein n=1 Tax=Tanacetum coccineum TaxID=301880 RepID=A0ABQ5F8I1_9ASTR
MDDNHRQPLPYYYPLIKRLLNAGSIIAALIDVNVAQSKLVLLENFNENYSKCLRLLVRSRGSDFDIPVVFSLVIALLRNKMVTTHRNSDDDVPNFEAMISAAVANALPKLFRATFEISDHNVIRNGVDISGRCIIGLLPTSCVAEDWITHMEKLFQVLGCPDNFKTRLAAFKLEGDALSLRYEREYGSICQLDRENSGEYMERFTRLASFVGCKNVAAAARNIELLHESEFGIRG